MHESGRIIRLTDPLNNRLLAGDLGELFRLINLIQSSDPNMLFSVLGINSVVTVMSACDLAFDLHERFSQHSSAGRIGKPFL